MKARAVVAAAIALHATLARVEAQGTPAIASGRVVRVAGADSIPARDVVVILHRVATDAQGPIDSLRSPTGRFDFRFRADSGVIYLVSARWQGIEYFATPLVVARDAAPAAVTVVVSDTSSRAVVTVAARHWIVAAPTADGTRNVVDLVVLANNGATTRVSADTTVATWRMLLPRYAANIELLRTDFATEALERRGDTLFVFAPIPPGDREISLQYQLPPGSRRFVVPIDQRVDTVNVLAEEASLSIDGGLVRGDSTITEQQRRFTRWTGAFAGPSEMTLVLTRDGVPPWLLPALIGGLGLALLVAGATTMLRGRARRAPAGPIHATPRAEAILERIARLDADHAAGQAASSPEAWAAYLVERAALKRELERATRRLG